MLTQSGTTSLINATTTRKTPKDKKLCDKFNSRQDMIIKIDRTLKVPAR